MTEWPRRLVAKDLHESIFYRPRGDGRDSYISCDNGGTTKPNEHLVAPPLGRFMRFSGGEKQLRPIDMARTCKYHCDGSGRDGFILGYSSAKQAQQAALLQEFTRDLRVYQDWNPPNCAVSSLQRRMKVTDLNPEMQRTSFKRIRVRALSIPRRRTDKFESVTNRFRQLGRSTVITSPSLS